MNDLAHSAIRALLPRLPANGLTGTSTGPHPAAETLNRLVLSAFRQIGRAELWVDFVADPVDPDLIERVLAAVLRDNPGLAADIERAVNAMPNHYSVVRRVGSRPEGPGRCSTTNGCPDILELDDGAFAVIGLDITEQVAGLSAIGAGCAADERVVRVPRNTLLAATRDL